MSLTIPQALDLLMALVLIMFLPIGLWRGALREWIALAGILLGYALANEWALPWGGDLAVLAAIDARVAHFAVASSFFLGVTLIVGYGAGVALPFRPDLSWPNRFVGALVGLGNGLLILSFALRIMQRHLFNDAADSPLRLSVLAAILIDYIGWAQLALLVLFVLCVLAGSIGRWRGRPALFEEYVPVYEYGEPDDARPYDYDDDYAPADDSWRAEPAASADRAHEQQTTVLRPVQPLVVREIVEAPASTPNGVADAAPVPPDHDDAETPARGTPAVAPDATPAALLAAAAPSRVRVIDIARPIAPPPHDSAAAPDDEPAPAPNGAPGGASETKCAICGTVVAPRARFCATCGHLIGPAERRAIANAH